MKIKSLLIGSAAAVVGVTSASAADIIIPEPEMVEYVRVCDAAGTGYFYIPGTETCLMLGGYVRYDMGFGEAKGKRSEVDEETWNTRARAEMDFYTWTDTELGDLRTETTLRFQWDTNDGAGDVGYTNTEETIIRRAYIDLAGLRLGRDESYFTQFTGYGGSVINDTDAGGYGPFETNLVAYTFSSGGFEAAISLEQGVNSDEITDVLPAEDSGWGIDNYVPHVVVGAGYDAGAFEIRGVFGYDTREDEAAVQRGGWAAKVRADVEFDPVSAFAMLLYGENSSAYNTWSKYTGGDLGDETFSVIAGLDFDITDDLAFGSQVQWVDAESGTDDAWSVVGNVTYEITDGFIFRPELVWNSYTIAADGTDPAKKVDEFGGTIRFQRSW